MKTLLQFLAAFSWAAKPNENESFRSTITNGNAYLTERVPSLSDQKGKLIKPQPTAILGTEKKKQHFLLRACESRGSTVPVILQNEY